MNEVQALSGSCKYQAVSYYIYQKRVSERTAN